MNADILIVKDMICRDARMEEFFNIEQNMFKELELKFEDIKRVTFIDKEILCLFKDLIEDIRHHFDEYLLSDDLDQKADILTNVSFLISKIRKTLDEIIY